MGDAIGRTLVRLLVTRRHLLEWVPAAQVTIGPRLDLLAFYRRMAGAVVIGVAGLMPRRGVMYEICEVVVSMFYL